ncbi:DUF2283 domain-containing protein [Nodosilinea nodulosa]|uniref:DUF2283 domain-containing protein n=1 Tax=Nodosilinea nodulosa TaxID=416001 RepID=UPI000318E1DD|nr:DUF2283 domain-containing protein [Nodosilinea nodulosa]
MKLVVHKEDDALYLRLDDTAIVESEEVSDGIILDYNAEGKVVGIEINALCQPAKPEFLAADSARNRSWLDPIGES